ncbi:hypothetical protein KAK07_24050 [Ideonella sp. 4Y16]|uniref:Uncharacterized protein n=1 Tax=Ideonella alba TaxID=2824118 RepID=A0A940YEI5_9BURK|nr:hypothetical protein [Ideonella alba]MBQ0932723.1 hypothetical protein [Ideonella alba]MBQ0946430.1 hypothetical protein [Ideonella alba]
MKTRLSAPRPRNPFVAPALRRQAGAHRRPASGQRQQARQELRQELAAPPDWRSP